MGKTYQRRRVKENPERDIALAMVVSSIFLRDIRSIFQPELIETPAILTVTRWCLDYYEKYQKAPGPHIEHIYEDESKAGRIDEDEEELILDLLASLSEEYERADEFNPDYFLEKAEKYLESRNITEHIKRVKNDVLNGEIDIASNTMEDYKSISLESGGGIDLMNDVEAIQSAFDTAMDPLFRLPGAAGKFLNDLFVRDAFITLLGPEKRGKTWSMIDLALWARRAGKNVAMFSAGDMTEPQLVLRFGTAMTRRNPRKKYCGELRIPTLDCWKNQTDECSFNERTGSFAITKTNKGVTELLPWDEVEDHVVCTHCRNHPKLRSEYKPSSWYKIREPIAPLDIQAMISGGNRFQRRYGRKKKILLKAYKNHSLTVAEIRRQLDKWFDKYGFIPDVIIIDYMDLLIGSKAAQNQQFRHGVNQIWAETRALSQERNCLVVSASQSDADSYYAKWITLKNFSEDKRKFSHVTGMITLNQLVEEKLRGQMRLGQLAVREDELNEKKFVTILQSIATGRFIVSSW